MSASKMNTLWQRVLKKNNEQSNAGNQSEREERKFELEGSRFAKGNWIGKLGNYSPTKCQVPASPTRTNAMKALNGSGICNTHEAVTPRESSESPEQSSLEMPDLESIIREFEMGYLSPSKQGIPMDASKQKNFVKKIVAAFEIKYKVYNDLRTTEETKEYLEDSSELDFTETDAPKRRTSHIVLGGSPFGSCRTEESKRFGKFIDPCDSKESSEDVKGAKDAKDAKDAKEGNGKSRIFSTPSKYDCRGPDIFGKPFELASDEDGNRDDSSEDTRHETKKENGRSGFFFTPSEDSRDSRRFLSPSNRSATRDFDSVKSDRIYASPVKQPADRRDSKDSSSASNSDIFKFDEEESDEKSDFQFHPLKVSSLDDTKIMDSIDFDASLPRPEETIFLGGNFFPKTSTMIGEIPKEEVQGVSSIVDRTPKIVGAFLKKPIEVEDTSIDWIPITGKKLPRKRSLKKLLSSFTGKKSLEKRSKMFFSEKNLSEESRELQDSGYDERSCSSSSLTSLISITEMLLQQENSYVEPERRTTLRTFRSRRSTDEEEDEAFYEASPPASREPPNKKKLFLAEVPREEVKLDLGPSYPPTSKILTMSLGRKAISKRTTRNPLPFSPLNRVPKHPNVSKIPKHPFVALTKMDEPRNPLDLIKPVIVKNDLYEVEFHRSNEAVGSVSSYRGSSSTRNHYDVPRRFLSKSETEISRICKSTGTKRRQEEPIYDVPKIHSSERPRSSVYEEALSLKRRSIDLVRPIPSLGGTFRPLESHYDTIGSKSCRIYRNRNTVHSDSDLASMERSSIF